MKERKSQGTWRGRGPALALLALLVSAWVLAACSTPLQADEAPLPTLAGLAYAPTETPLPPAPAQEADKTPSPALRVSAAPTGTPTRRPTPAAIPSPEATADPYAALSIAALAEREYGGGLIQIERRLEWTNTFARYLISYPSDGLQIYGFLNVPHEGDRFPVALVLHGYIEPEEYEVTAYTTRYADALTEAGYMVFHPNYRNYPPSTIGDNPFRTGYAIDILNLIAIIREQSQDPTGTLRRADASSMYVLGHSMGGGVALRVSVVWPEAIRALALYGSMSGDERQNYERIRLWASGRSWQFELAASPEAIEAISPLYALDQLRAPVSIHHGAADTVVPALWSRSLCTTLQEMAHEVDCFSYEGQPHTFYGEADALLQERVIAFFRRH